MATTTKSAPAQRNGHRTAPALRDEFDSTLFEAGRESQAYLQMLNHQDPNQSGFFITLDNMEAVGFQPNEEWSHHRETFQSGETAEGYRSLTARFLILRKSKLLMFDRDSGKFLGVFQKARYDRNNMVLKTRYLVYLLSKNKQLLHHSPLLFTAKGSFNGSFGEVVRKFQSEMSKAYGMDTGARKPRGDRFMALSTLAVRVQPELKGDKKKSWACSVESYGIPTAENWKSYFVGYTEVLKEKLLAEFEEWATFGTIEADMGSDRRPADADEDSDSLDGNDDDF